jgi:sulfopyruvate decarboxylase subunit beta
MIRSEILKEIAPILRDQLVICNIGLPSQELHMIDDQPTNFYMLGTCVVYRAWRGFGARQNGHRD